jgi:hypothetical protein
MNTLTPFLLVILAWSAGIQTELAERMLMKYAQNPHPSLSRKAGEGKEENGSKNSLGHSDGRGRG